MKSAEKFDFDVFAANCPSRSSLEHVFNRWNVLILAMLTEGRARFSAIRNRIEGISDRMLSKSLRLLQEDGLIERHDFQSNPPHVEYSLTDSGRRIARKVLKLIDQLYEEMN